MENRKRIILLEHIVFFLLAGFCIASLGCILLYVIVHGLEKKVWEYRYLLDLMVALFLFTIVKKQHVRVHIVNYKLKLQNVYFSIFILLILSLALQYAVISSLELAPHGDYAVFYCVAKDISQCRNIYLSEYVALFPHILGYSSFLGVLFRFFGRNDIAPFVNILLGSSITLLLFFIVLRRSSLSAAVFVSVAWLFCPSMLIYNTMVLSEPLYASGVLLIVIAVYGTESYFDKSKVLEDSISINHFLTVVFIYISGLFFGLILRAVQVVRPVSYILLIALIIWIIQYRPFLFSERFNYRSCVLFLSVLFLSYFISGKVWSSYIYHMLHELPASVPGYNFLTGFNPETSGTHSDMDYQLLLAARDLPGATADSAQRAMLDLLFERLRSGLGFLPRLIAEKLKVFSGSDDSAVIYASSALSSKGQSILAHLCNIYYYSLLLQVAATCIRWVKCRTSHRVAFFAALYILGLSAAHILFLEVNGRYHYSFIPLLLLILSEGYSVSGAPVEKSSQISR